MNLNKLSAISCEYQGTTLPYSSPTHFHPYFELVYYISGEGYGYINDKKYEYHAGTFIIINPFIKHSEVSTKESNLFVVTFKAPYLNKDFKESILSDNQNKDVLQKIKMIYDEYRIEKPYFIEKISLLIGELVIDICRDYMSDVQEKYDILVVKNYIDENFLEDIDYNYLATKVFYSYDHLRHYFKKETNMSLKQYKMNKTIDYAKYLIFKGYSIKDVALKCRFYSSSHFISAFKKVTNQTPLEFKALIKNKKKKN